MKAHVATVAASTDRPIHIGPPEAPLWLQTDSSPFPVSVPYFLAVERACLPKQVLPLLLSTGSRGPRRETGRGASRRVRRFHLTLPSTTPSMRSVPLSPLWLCLFMSLHFPLKSKSTSRGVSRVRFTTFEQSSLNFSSVNSVFLSNMASRDGIAADVRGSCAIAPFDMRFWVLWRRSRRWRKPLLSAQTPTGRNTVRTSGSFQPYSHLKRSTSGASTRAAMVKGTMAAMPSMADNVLMRGTV